MSIKREDIDRRLIDIADVVSGRRLPTVHPGAILRDELLVPMGISVYALAHAIEVAALERMTLCSAVARLRRIRPCVWPATSACHRSSG